jgi:Transposase IS116/IS110/IS902 family
VLRAAKLIGKIAGIGWFSTDAKLARTCGAAPIPASSGRTDRHRLDHGGNRQLNCARHRLAVTKARLDPTTATYIARKRAEGKSRRKALRCLKRHLARRICLLQPFPPTGTAIVTAARDGRPRDHDPLQQALRTLLLDIGSTTVLAWVLSGWGSEMTLCEARRAVPAAVVLHGYPHGAWSAGPLECRV